jgi:septal ring factor EnvC (AmiA/AmiB activator)
MSKHTKSIALLLAYLWAPQAYSTQLLLDPTQPVTGELMQGNLTQLKRQIRVAEIEIQILQRKIANIKLEISREKKQVAKLESELANVRFTGAEQEKNNALSEKFNQQSGYLLKNRKEKVVKSTTLAF